jgi:hypothetical protein
MDEHNPSTAGSSALIDDGALPLPFPVPFPPDWFQCLRRGPVSGRYEGEMTGPSAGRFLLDLRIDIDPRYANSPITNRISGDLYDLYRFGLPGFPSFTWRVFRESWIVDAPTVTWSRCEVNIAGTMRFWQGSHPPTNIAVRIPWGTLTAAGPAHVTLTQTGTANQTYTCVRKSDNFRDITLEVDVVQSASASLIVPSYDTHAHPTRPADLPQRVLTIEEAYREAGVGVTIRPGRSIINDSAPEFSSWSPAELHDAMETFFSQIGGTWPKWELWGLLAGSYENAGVGGSCSTPPPRSAARASRPSARASLSSATTPGSPTCQPAHPPTTPRPKHCANTSTPGFTRLATPLISCIPGTRIAPIHCRG